MSLVWIQLWPPLYAILNYVATLASAEPRSRGRKRWERSPGLALETAGQHLQRRDLRPGHRRLHGDLDPDHRHRDHQGRRGGVPGGDRRRRRPVGGIRQKRRSTSRAASPRTRSRWTSSSWPDRSSAFMSTTSDATAPPSRAVARMPASSATRPTDEPAGQHLHLHRAAGERPGRKRTRSRDAGTHRARGHAAQPGTTALTRALGIQDLRARPQQRSGATTTSDGGSTSDPVPDLNSVARDVNRRLGLSDDSTVGKSVAASASVGRRFR